jgi:hypothetical protein
MRKTLAAAVLTGIASVFAVTGSAQVPPNAMALSASAPAHIEAQGNRFAMALLPEGPAPASAWVFAAGFLALVVLRRIGGSTGP